MDPFHILFICTHNSARSILAEALASTHGNGKLIGYSAGSTPTGVVHPQAIALALDMGYPLEKIRSKSWDEFAKPDAQSMDFVITVCDDAAGEVCPVWLGHPVTGHWGVADPSRVAGSEHDIHTAFMDTLMILRKRIQLLCDLPLDRLDDLSLHHHLREIGEQH